MSLAEQIYPKKYYPFLDGFRALSILWVIIHHIFVFFDPVSLAHPVFIPLLLIAKLGLLGVDMFFVISGFLITGLLIGDLDDKIRMRRFYLRRIFKIIPQYSLCIVGGVIMLLLVKSLTIWKYTILDFKDGAVHLGRLPADFTFSWNMILAYTIFIQNYAQQIGTLAHTWSIAIEEHFYIGYPILLFFITKVNKDFYQRRRLLIFVFIMLILAVNYFRYVCIVQLSVTPHLTTLFRIDALAFGCLLRIFEPMIYAIDKQKLKKWSPYCLLTGIVLYIILFVTRYYHYATGYHNNMFAILIFNIYYLAPGFIMLSALMGFEPIKRITSNRILIWIGKSSYGTYLWHYVIIFPFAYLQQYIPAVWAIFLYVLASLYIGHLSTVTLEKYFLNIRKKVAP